MCGIVGLLVKREALREQLGAMMVPMLIGMSDRGCQGWELETRGRLHGAISNQPGAGCL